jgi:hypothetical protein
MYSPLFSTSSHLQTQPPNVKLNKSKLDILLPSEPKTSTYTPTTHPNHEKHHAYKQTVYTICINKSTYRSSILCTYVFAQTNPHHQRTRRQKSHPQYSFKKPKMINITRQTTVNSKESSRLERRTCLRLRRWLVFLPKEAFTYFGV